MEVKRGPKGKTPLITAPATRCGSRLDGRRVAELLGRWQPRELRVAASFWECRGLTVEQLQDLYQDTTLALMRRPYNDEVHLQRTLRRLIRRRALNLYRDEARRQEILAERATLLHPPSHQEQTPEQLALVREDALLITEFLAELSGPEQAVFSLTVEGLGYNSIAKTLAMPVGEARKLARACERKRERFVLLYETGRLCSYRAATIQALQAHQATSSELAQRALAHLQACPHCRAEHKTNAQRLRAAFQEQAAALLPVPILAVRLSPYARAWLRARTLAYRLPQVWGSSPAQGAVRERAAALLAGGGAAKITAGVIAAVAVAGATITAAHHATPGRPARQQPRVYSAPPVAAPESSIRPAASVQIADAAVYHAQKPRHQARPHQSLFAPGYVVTSRSRQSVAPAGREQTGFAYLGVPSTPPSPPPATARASAQPAQHGGGPFSP
jgi:RNA polymerase sigma factor (sigma-70 family)